eukprot:7695845-Karenia_brevis.AAC.1
MVHGSEKRSENFPFVAFGFNPRGNAPTFGPPPGLPMASQAPGYLSSANMNPYPNEPPFANLVGHIDPRVAIPPGGPPGGPPSPGGGGGGGGGSIGPS